MAKATVKAAKLEALERACQADPDIRALDMAVNAMVVAARVCDGPSCYGCVWEMVLKPLASPLIGWERGYPRASAKDPEAPIEVISMAELLRRPATPRRPSESDTETWLRTSEAWDAVTDVWLERLEEADPGTGHGIAWRAA